jgi:hypothetical protein
MTTLNRIKVVFSYTDFNFNKRIQANLTKMTLEQKLNWCIKQTKNAITFKPSQQNLLSTSGSLSNLKNY